MGIVGGILESRVWKEVGRVLLNNLGEFFSFFSIMFGKKS